MAIEGFTALQECSRKASTTVDRARYWLKLLGVETVKCGHVRYVPDTSIPHLGNMARLVAGGMAPSEAAKKAMDETPAPLPAVQVPGQVDRFDGIEKSLLAMAEKMNLILEENRALRSEVSVLQKAIEYRKPEPPAVTPETTTRIIPQKEDTPRRSASKVPVQRQLSVWESITLFFDDALGFIGLGG